jgi:RHS repeat-associated protein
MVVEPLSPPNNMTYDGENRMTAFSGNGGAASYTYDGNGLRVVKSLQGGTTTVSVFAGSSVLAEYDNGAAPGSPSREYIHGASGLLAMISGGATTYYHQDHLSVRLTTDANGNILSQDGHFPFGEQWYQSGANNKFVFTSYQRDSESGLDYALARYYDSRTGTFCSADPLAGDPGDPQSWNRYPYGRNDPIDITDPSGKSWWSSLLIDVGVAVAAYFAPEVLPDLVGAGGGATSGSITVTVLGQSSTTYYAWGADAAASAGGTAAITQSSHDTNPPQTPQPQTPTTPQTPKKNCPPKFANFFKQAPIFNALAKQLNTKALFLMAQSSWETGWLGPHAQDLHQLFGMTHAGGNDIKYSSYQRAADAYSKAYSPYVSNTSTMDQFTAGLKSVPPHGYNTKNPNYYKNITDQQQYVKQHAADCGATVN